MPLILVPHRQEDAFLPGFDLKLLADPTDIGVHRLWTNL